MSEPRDPAREAAASSSRDHSAARIGAITGVLTVAMGSATIAAFALGALGPAIVADLDISHVQFGSLSAVLFLVGVVASPFAGSYTDRFGGRWMLVVLFGTAGGCFALMSLADTYVWFLLAISVGGLAIGASNPATNAIAAHNIPVRARGSAIGIKQSGVFMGSILAGALLAPLAVRHGWQGVFLAVGALMLMAAPLSLAAVPGGDAARAGGLQVGSRAQTVVSLRWLSALAFFAGAGTVCLTAYVALFANDELGMRPSTAAQLITVLGVSGVTGRLLWAEITNRTNRRFLALTSISILAAAGQAAVVASALTGSQAALWAGVATVGATAGAFNAVAMVIVVRGWTGQPAGRSSGAVQASFQAGLVVSPFVFGLLVDVSGGYMAAWLYTFVVFSAGSAVALYGHRRAERAHR